MTLRATLAATLGLALAACGGILPRPAPPPALYRLTPLAEATPTGPALATQIVVDPPRASAALDTPRIALTRGAYGFDYFADSAWIDSAPALVQTLVVDSLEDSGRLPLVAGSDMDLRPDAILTMDLRRFQASYDGSGPPQVEVWIDARLVAASDRTVLAARSFDGAEKATANDMPAIVAAFDGALHQALAGLPDWAVSALARRPQ